MYKGKKQLAHKNSHTQESHAVSTWCLKWVFTGQKQEFMLLREVSHDNAQLFLFLFFFHLGFFLVPFNHFVFLSCNMSRVQPQPLPFPSLGFISSGHFFFCK